MRAGLLHPVLNASNNCNAAIAFFGSCAVAAALRTGPVEFFEAMRTLSVGASYCALGAYIASGEIFKTDISYTTVLIDLSSTPSRANRRPTAP